MPAVGAGPKLKGDAAALGWSLGLSVVPTVGAGPKENGEALAKGAPNPKAGVLSVDGAPKPKGDGVELLPDLVSVVGAPKLNGEAPLEGVAGVTAMGAPKSKACALRNTSERLGLVGLALTTALGDTILVGIGGKFVVDEIKLAFFCGSKSVSDN